MLAWDRWVAKSFAARTTAIQAETKKARLCFVRFLARNASISRRDRQYTFLWPYNTSDGDHDVQEIGCEPVSSRFVGMPKPSRRGLSEFHGFPILPPPPPGVFFFHLPPTSSRSSSLRTGWINLLHAILQIR